MSWIRKIFVKLATQDLGWKVQGLSWESDEEFCYSYSCRFLISLFLVVMMITLCHCQVVILIPVDSRSLFTGGNWAYNCSSGN